MHALGFQSPSRRLNLLDPAQRATFKVMNVDAIKELIEHLPPEDQTVLACWMSERDAKAWDDQIEQDFSTGGAGMGLLEEVDAQIDAGNLQSFKVTRQR